MLLEESPLLSLSGKGDYIVPWHGALFLNNGSIINLLESAEQTVYAGEFSPCAGYSIPEVDSLSVASSRAIASAEFIMLRPEDEEALPNDDGYKAFTIKDVKVLRSELGKLGLAEAGTSELLAKLGPEPKVKKGHSSTLDSWIMWKLQSMGSDISEPPHGFQARMIELATDFG